MPRRIGQQVYYRPEGNGGRISVDGARAAAAPEPPANVYNGMRDVFETASRAGGNILRVLGDAYRTHQRGLVDEAIVNAAGEFEAWKADYMRDNQGKDAMAAQVDFTRKWAEISEKTMGDFGGEGTIFRNELKREMFKRGLYAFRDGGDWQNRQTDAWRKSVWKGRLAEFEQTVAEHPEDGDRIKMDFESLMQSWQANNPGLDPAAARAELWDKAVSGRVQSFLARKDTEGAWAALYEDGGGSGGAADLPPARGTIAEDHFNPLNLKHAGKRGAAKDRSAFRVFNNDGEGYRGAYRQLLLYQDRDGLKTPGQMISKWAPRSENNLDAYRKTLEKHGVAWDREIDLHDQEQAAKFLKAASAHEGPVGQRYSAGEIREMLDGAPGKRGSLAGKDPAGGISRTGASAAAGSGSYLSARERFYWKSQIEAAENRRKAEKAVILRQEIEDYTAMTRDGIMPKNRPNDAEIYEVFGDKAAKMIEQLDYQGDYAVALGMIRDMSPKEIAENENKLKPEEDSGYAGKAPFYHAWRQAVAQDAKAREKDPVGYIAEFDPRVKAARENFYKQMDAASFTEYQIALETGAGQRGMDLKGAILPEADAKMLAERIRTDADPLVLVKRLYDAAGKKCNELMKQIMPKSPVIYQVALSGMEEATARTILKAANTPHYIKNAFTTLGTERFKESDLDAAISRAMFDFNQTYLAGSDNATTAGINYAVKLLALDLCQRGRTYNAAVKEAAQKIILDRYETGKINGVSFRVPKRLDDSELDIDELENGAAKIQTDLVNDPDGLYISLDERYGKDARSKLQGSILRKAYWITNFDESGLIMFMNGHALYKGNGELAMYSWKDIVNKSRDKNAKPAVDEFKFYY